MVVISVVDVMIEVAVTLSVMEGVVVDRGIYL